MNCPTSKRYERMSQNYQYQPNTFNQAMEQDTVDTDTSNWMDYLFQPPNETRHETLTITSDNYLEDLMENSEEISAISGPPTQINDENDNSVHPSTMSPAVRRWGALPSFLRKLWDMLQSNNKFVKWSPDGSTIIYDKTYEHELKNYFQAQKEPMASHVRQLNMYGFKKCKTQSRNVEEFHNPDFKRDEPDRIVNIKRNAPSSSGPRPRPRQYQSGSSRKDSSKNDAQYLSNRLSQAESRQANFDARFNSIENAVQSIMQNAESVDGEMHYHRKRQMPPRSPGKVESYEPNSIIHQQGCEKIGNARF